MFSGFGVSVVRCWVSGRTHLLSLPPEKKKAVTLGFRVSGISIFFGLRRKLLRMIC
jgi:hypothetical protein